MPHYVAFVDPAGGSGADSFALAIAHGAHGKGVLDAVRVRKPPFSPDAVCADYAQLLRSYGLSGVVGDAYGGEWPRERFRVHGIDYRLSERTKSEIYAALVPLLNAGRVELLDLPELRTQFLALERRVSAGGREQIVHLVGAHDDVANAVAGALVLAAGGSPWDGFWQFMELFDVHGNPRTPEAARMLQGDAAERAGRGPQDVAQPAERFSAHGNPIWPPPPPGLCPHCNGRTVESTGPIALGLRLQSSQNPGAWRTIIYEKGTWILLFICYIIDLVVICNRQPGSHLRSTEASMSTAIPLHR